VKNQFGSSFKEAEFEIIYNEGISSVGSLLDLALEFGIVQKRGSWFSYNGSQLAQGRDGAKEALKGDEEIYNEVEALVLEKLEGDKE